VPRLTRAFFSRACLEVAPDLLGLYLVHDERAGRIVEVEAYVHEEDEACHARFGRTQRAATLYGPPGHAYVFLIYGMYDCFNVVTEPKDSPAAVLIRAAEPVPPLEGGTDGPGKLCRASHQPRAQRRRSGQRRAGMARAAQPQKGAHRHHTAHRRRLRRRLGEKAVALPRRRLALGVATADLEAATAPFLTPPSFTDQSHLRPHSQRTLHLLLHCPWLWRWPRYYCYRTPWLRQSCPTVIWLVSSKKLRTNRAPCRQLRG
jgi:DNA-3-methyladenine glycosylase